MEREGYIKYQNEENHSGVIIKYHTHCLDSKLLSDKVKEDYNSKLIKTLVKIKSDFLSEYITFKVVISFSDPDGKNNNYQNRISIYPEKLFNGKINFRIEDVMKVLLADVVEKQLVFDCNNMTIDAVFIPPLYTSRGVRCQVKTKHIYVDVEGEIKVSDLSNDIPYEVIQIILSNSIGCKLDSVSIPHIEEDTIQVALNYDLNIHNIMNSFNKNLPCIQKLSYRITDVIDSVINYNKCNLKDIIYMGFDINGININTDNINFRLKDEPYIVNKNGLTIHTILDSIEQHIAVKLNETPKTLEGMLYNKFTTNTNYGLIIFPNGILCLQYDYGNIKCEFYNGIKNLYLLLPE